MHSPPRQLEKWPRACLEKWHIPLVTASRQRSGEILKVTWLLAGLLSSSIYCLAQKAPATAAKPWYSPAERDFIGQVKTPAETDIGMDADKPYSLAELIDLAEQHNPDTRLAWQAAKTQAAELGVAKSSLYPAVAAVALANTGRFGELIGDWNLQTIGLFQPTLNIDYLIFDFGGRRGAIAAAKANFFAANFAFNDTHRKSSTT